MRTAEEAFGGDINCAMLVKRCGPGSVGYSRSAKTVMWTSMCQPPCAALRIGGARLCRSPHGCSFCLKSERTPPRRPRCRGRVDGGASGEPAACHDLGMPYPKPTSARTPCWHCRYMISVDARTTIAHCGREREPTWRTSGSQGCDWWEREPGIDDDDWNPVGSPAIAPYKPDPAPPPRDRGRDGWWTEPKRSPRPPVPLAPVFVLPARDPFGGMFSWNDDG